MSSNAAALCDLFPATTCPTLLPAPSAVPAAKNDPFQLLGERGFLEALLRDRTTGKNIIWATDTYSRLGSAYGRKRHITPDLLAGRHAELMNIRRESRNLRTRKHGEVFTPLHVCKIMCDHACETLRGMDWRKYILTTVMEITCGEAPFLASRKDLASGEDVPLKDRVGILDRKMQVIGEKTESREEWIKWAFKAFESTYGYEFQGDNLLMARMNLLATFEEYLKDRWRCRPSSEEYERLLNIISWNIWQMDGLTGTLPYGKIANASLFSLFEKRNSENPTPPCVIKDWKDGEVFTYLSMGA